MVNKLLLQLIIELKILMVNLMLLHTGKFTYGITKLSEFTDFLSNTIDGPTTDVRYARRYILKWRIMQVVFYLKWINRYLTMELFNQWEE